MPGDASALSLARRARIALQWSYGGALARAGLQLLLQLALARLLGPRAFGQATVVFFLLSLGWLFAEGGFGAALVQKRDCSDDDIGYALGWVLTMSCGAGAVLALVSPWLAPLLGGAELQPLIVAAAALVPLQALGNIPQSLLRRQLDMRRLQVIQLGAYVVGYAGTGLPLAWAGAGAWSLVAAFAVQSAIGLVATYAKVRHPLRPRWRGDASLRRFGLAVCGTNLVNWALDNVERVLIGRYWGSAALGEYAAAANLSKAPANLLVNSASSVTFAAASRAQDSPEVLARAQLAAMRLCLLIACPAFVWAACHARWVVHLLYGERWTGAVDLLVPLCLSLPFYVLLSIAGPMLWAVDAVRLEMRAQLAMLVLLPAGLLACLGGPLRWVAWLMPLVYAIRWALVYLPLARRLGIGWLATASAMAPGFVLGGLALAFSVACTAAFDAPGAALGSAGLLVVAGALLLRQAPRWWLGSMLLDRLPAAGPWRRWLPVAP